MSVEEGQDTGPSRTTSAVRVPAVDRPVGRVLPMLGLPHLDRDFDYLIPESLSAKAVIGCRVRVRFAGRLVDGYLLDRCARSEHSGDLAWLERVVSPEVVLTPELERLTDHVARRWMGVRSDVLRLAIPPRHAAAEKSVPPQLPTGGQPIEGPVMLPPGWESNPMVTSFLGAAFSGLPARATWTVPPGIQWASSLAGLADQVRRRGRQALLVVPDQRDVELLAAACRELVADKDEVADLSAALGPSARYRRWLRAVRGHARIVVGTRSAIFTPLPEPGLVVVYDDGDESFVEPRAPYPHTRDVAVLRSHLDSLPLLLSAPDRTPEVTKLVQSGWAPEIRPRSGWVREQAPRILALTDADPRQARDIAGGHTRIPAIAVGMARDALDAGRPVLVQVPRKGYLATLLCGHCHGAVRCRRCNGPVRAGRMDSVLGPVELSCGWCGAPETSFRCSACGSSSLRAGVIGSTRTAEELGRMFPGHRVRTSLGDGPLTRIEPGPGLVVCSPGLEPTVPGGYGCALLLDAWALLGIDDLRAHQRALRRWIGAASLVLPARDGGHVFLSADATLPVAQALVRWDPQGFAERELAERQEVGFPPAVHMIAIDGGAEALAEILDAMDLALGVEPLGPVDLPDGVTLPGRDHMADPERLLLRVPPGQLESTASQIRALIASRSGRRRSGAVRVDLDPERIG